MNINLYRSTLQHPFILAPLAGYTDLAFRLLCREYGADMCYSEMISCHGLVYEQQNTLNMIQTCADERPVVMQLFGSEPEIMAEAAAILSEQPIDMIDINMGCPVKKVIKKGAGAALMKDAGLARAIITTVVKKSRLPVSIKIRSGWNHQNITAPEFAKMAEDAGAALITVHARTWTDGFSGTIDFNVIKKVKASVTIPVIGNGDIHTYADGEHMLKQTGCDGVMIGRRALGAPWIFSKNVNPQPSLLYRLTALQRHLELVEQIHPTDKILAKIKNHAGKYFRGVLQGSSIRRQIYDAPSFLALKNLLHSLHGQHS